MLARYATAATTGTIVTFGLLFVMQALISMTANRDIDVRTRHTLGQFIMEPRILELRTKDLIPPVEELTKTILPPARPTNTTDVADIKVARQSPPTPTTQGIPVFSAFNDGPLVAIVRVAPNYPVRATTMGIEGYVIVQFDVLTNGTVSNVSVVESTHSIFDREAVKAAERFRYKPRVVDGVAMTSHGIQTKLTFELDGQ